MIHVLTYAPAVSTSERVVDEVVCGVSPSAAVAAAAAAFLASLSLFFLSSKCTNLWERTITLQTRQERQREILSLGSGGAWRDVEMVEG